MEGSDESAARDLQAGAQSDLAHYRRDGRPARRPDSTLALVWFHQGQSTEQAAGRIYAKNRN